MVLLVEQVMIEQQHLVELMVMMVETVIINLVVVVEEHKIQVYKVD